MPVKVVSKRRASCQLVDFLCPERRLFSEIVAPMLLGIFNFHSGFDRLFASRVFQVLLTSLFRTNFRWNFVGSG